VRCRIKFFLRTQPPESNLNFIFLDYGFIRKFILFFNKKEAKGMKSSPYGLCTLGYTRVTKVKTKSYDGASLGKSLKITLVQIVF